MGKTKKTGARQGDSRRGLPSMTELLNHEAIQALIEAHSRTAVTETLRAVQARFGKELKKGGPPPGVTDVIAAVQAALEEEELDQLRPVVNAMGIVLHTGLGRAPLARSVSDALSQMHRCCNLQVDMADGQRGKRNYMTEKLICKLTGAEAAVIVNNNAAATFLTLMTMSQGKEVIVSRGQLIEIGGSFRLPDCMKQSGALMREVGTTNKTHLRDYENAITENTGAIIRIYPSNFRVVGFTKSVSIEELSTLKEKHDFVLIDDLGCGALVDLEKLGLPLEPTVPSSIAQGADLICCSGDKLIGGPQAGVIMGKKELIAKIKKHPMTRMLRACKMTDMALEKTLRLFLDPETLLEKHPVFRMLTTPMQTLKRKATQLKNRLEKEKLPLKLRVGEDFSAVGGGAMPDHPLETIVLALRSPDYPADKLNLFLREHQVPVMGRVSKNEVLLDMRTLLEGEEKIVFEAIKNIPPS